MKKASALIFAAMFGVFGVFGVLTASPVLAAPDQGGGVAGGGTGAEGNAGGEAGGEAGGGNGGTVEREGVEGDCPEGCVKTSILGDENGCFCPPEDQNGNPAAGGIVLKLLQTVVDVLTVGVGILAVIGITVVGLQYLTAGGSEEKTRTAKRRMFEIVIGLVAYVMIYAILKWLLPTFGT